MIGSIRASPFGHRLAAILLPLVLAAGFALPHAVRAAECGDDIDGRRVPCACGDVVVSDATLLATDPVVSARCPFDGLIVSAPPVAESITLDLGGHAIVGNGKGRGLLVERGGADGAVIVGGAAGELAEIVGFATGFLSPRVGALRRIERLVFKGNRVDGFLLRGNGVIAEELTARTNGRDGIRVMGRGGRFTDLRAENNRGSGLRFETRDAIVEGTSSGNLKHGLLLSGSGNDVSAVIARENGGYGAILRGRDQNSAGLVSEDNSKSTPRRAVEERGR